jgi:hypothetical protein
MIGMHVLICQICTLKMIFVGIQILSTAALPSLSMARRSSYHFLTSKQCDYCDRVRYVFTEVDTIQITSTTLGLLIILAKVSC